MKSIAVSIIRKLLTIDRNLEKKESTNTKNEEMESIIKSDNFTGSNREKSNINIIAL